MTTHRRYTFRHPGQWNGQPDAWGRVLTVLEAACEARWWFQDPEVAGEPFGLLAFSVTVSGRDQWFAHKRVLALAVDCYYSVGLREEQVPDPAWEPLEPHTNRGRYRSVVTDDEQQEHDTNRQPDQAGN